MVDIICTILEGCVNSYTNRMTEYIDVYNKEHSVTDIKCCITRRKENENSFIINLQYNPKIILGVMDIKDDKIISIDLRKDLYKSLLKVEGDNLLEFELKELYKNKTLKFSTGM